jgi:phospholipase D1/2
VKLGRGRRPAWGKIALIALVTLALAAAWRYTPLAEVLTAERISSWSRSVQGRKWAPAVLMLAYTPAAFLMFPRPLLTLASVITFGPWLGIGYSTAGILVAALITYYAGRAMSYEKVRRLAGDKLDPASGVLRRHGVLATFALNMVPVPPFAVQGMIAGAIRVKVWQYALGTLLSIAPAAVAWFIFGDQLTTALEDPSKATWWLLAGVLVALTLLIYFVRRWLSKQIAGVTPRRPSVP